MRRHGIDPAADERGGEDSGCWPGSISRLAKSDPGNASCQRDLSVSYTKIGDVLVAQGNLPEALKTYQDSLAIVDRLAKSDPGNALWQRDLSVSNERLGDVFFCAGQSASRA